jgi:molybdopterin-guanine dinucleotide biosynthesis protein A
VSEFNPYQVTFYRGPGPENESLVRRVIGALSSEFDVGHVRRYTERGGRARDAVASRAAAALIEDGSRAELSTPAPLGPFDARFSLLESDFVVIEGDVDGADDKVLVIDGQSQQAGSVRPAARGNVVAWVTRHEEPVDQEVPRYHPDDVEGIADLLRAHWSSKVAAVPLFGLVLAGGKSQRMGRPKWALNYRGEPHALLLYRMVARHCSRTFLSIRKEQEAERELADLPHVSDRYLDLGPLGGILSAMTEHPEAAWLVVACDLPFLENATLERLIDNRAPFRFATSYRSPRDRMPEPVCAIYEPKARLRLFQSVGLGHHCPRKMLMNSRIALVESEGALELSNVNHPHEYREAVTRLGSGGSERND